MASRGEASFVRMPAFGAALYDALMRGDNLDRHYAEIAADLVERGARGRLLDVGMGPGRVLLGLHRLAPALELHGLDISAAMVERCRRNLGDVAAQLRVGTIRETDYPDGHFDVVTSAGSFYLWDEPAACLDEIFRILRPGGAACLYETHRDFDVAAFRSALATVQAGLSWPRRKISAHFLRKQLALTYSVEEVRAIVRGTRFSSAAEIEPIVLAGLPVALRIALRRS